MDPCLRRLRFHLNIHRRPSAYADASGSVARAGFPARRRLRPAPIPGFVSPPTVSHSSSSPSSNAQVRTTLEGSLRRLTIGLETKNHTNPAQAIVK
jgi:hypothetical protein